MKRNLVFALATLPAVALLLAPADGSAAPVFARKYGFECTMCHAGFPRLNDFGVRFRDHGYRVPSREGEEITVLQGAAPFAMRVTAGYVYEKAALSSAPALNQFQVTGVDLLSGGMLGERAGYFAAYVPRLEESRSVAGQTGTLESASVQFLLLPDDRLNLRAGKFEPYALPFSVRRHLGFAPYEIYEFAFPGGTPLSDVQAGVEMISRSRAGLRAAAGWFNGGESNRGSDAPGDGYIRLAWVFGPGEGQTAGQRIGVTGYVGQARSGLEEPLADGGGARRTFYRVGADASLNWSQFNLALQWLLERDDQVLWGSADDPTISGGFAELTFLPTDALTLFARFDLVRIPEEVEALLLGVRDVSRATAGVRLYLESSLTLHGEYSHRAETSAPAGEEEAKTDYGILALDWAF